MKTERKGFAIVLVAALAGLIFLLGATLVAISQLQTASANYDQRVRLAREHARAAMDMAVAELQQHLGKDTAVSFLADTQRETTTDDFDLGPTAVLKQPFWTGAKSGVSEIWLVTRQVDGTTAEPFDASLTEPVTLLGTGSVSDAKLEVQVPREAIKVSGVDGYNVTDAKTIGHYAYWVGDLGVKASYALYNKSPVTLHDEYGTLERRNRLAQLSLRQPRLETVDTNGASASAALSNPDRIDAFSNDFQFREAYGASSEPERFLLGLTEAEVEDSFHDFTPLSKGLLVDSAKGGFKRDLSIDPSNLTASVDTDYDARFLDYTKLAKSAVSTSTVYDDDVFPVQASPSPVAPVITQFNLNYSLYLSAAEEGEQTVFVSFAAALELWNPFSSTIGLGNKTLVLEIDNLPRLSLWLNSGSTVAERDWSAQLEGLGGTTASFEFNAIGGSNGPSDPITQMRPGQISVLSGPAAADASGTSRFPLSFGPDQIDVSTDRVVVDAGTVTVGTEALTSLLLRFGESSTAIETVDLKVRLLLKDSATATEDPLSTYSLPSSFTLGSEGTSVSDIVASGTRSFGFSWEVKDSVLETLGTYHPMGTSLLFTDLDGFSDFSYAPVNRTLDFSDADTDLLGYNPSDLSGTVDPGYDLPQLQLPKQELSSVAQLSGAHGTSWLSPSVGDPGSSENDLFDRFFFSTVPKIAGTWGPQDPLPNAGYVPLAGTEPVDLTANTSAESLYVHGMFNVHSTSIDAWASLLKGFPSSDSSYWSSRFSGDQYLFFNLPLGGEDSYLPVPTPAPDPPPEDDPYNYPDEALFASYKSNVIALTDGEVDLLARYIVAGIRSHVDLNGPFGSLQEFVDSGVLKAAIAKNYFLPKTEGEEGEKSLNADWIVPGSPAELRQSTLLNLIGAYLSVRSDTFLVRAYGDAVDPGDESKIWARAYCEAIVQRTHKPHATLGRQFEVVAFRWLSPSEI